VGGWVGVRVVQLNACFDKPCFSRGRAYCSYRLFVQGGRGGGGEGGTKAGLYRAGLRLLRGCVRGFIKTSCGCCIMPDLPVVLFSGMQACS